MKNDRGFILIYMVLIMAGIAMLASAALPSVIALQEVEQAKKTAAEVAFIQDAALHIKKETGSHATSMDHCKSMGKLPSTFDSMNPWGNLYSLDTTSGQIIVSTTVPSRVSNILVELLPNTTVVLSGGNATVSSNAKSPS